MSVALSEVCVKVKEKYFKTKQTCSTLLNVNAMIYFKYELQLKFRNKETANFHTGLC